MVRPELFVKVKINGQEANDPINLQELTIELNYDKDRIESRISTNEWELGVGNRTGVDGARLANEHIEGGNTGAFGVLEGMPFLLELHKAGQINDLFDGFVDLGQGLIECDRVTAPAIETARIDWLEKNVNFSFEYLESIGIITDNDNVLVPYVISTLPQTTDAVIMVITLFVTATELKNQLQAMSEFLAGMVNPFSFDNILKLALRIAYIALLIVTIIKLIKDVIDLIIQPVKYHSGMYYLDLCKKGAEHLGMTFESPILEHPNIVNWLWLPEKNQVFEADNGVLGFIQKTKTNHKGYYKGTYGSWLNLMKQIFKAKLIVDDNVIKLVPEDFNDSTALYQIPNVERGGYRFNVNEFSSNYTITFATDINDKNTIKEYLGTSVQIQTLPETIQNQGMVLMDGLTEINLPFALGKRKTSLTAPEKIVKTLRPILNPVIKAMNIIIFIVVGGVLGSTLRVIITAFKVLKFLGVVKEIPKALDVGRIQLPTINNPIEDRLGMLKMENDFITVPKTIMVANNADPRNNKLLPLNEVIISAEYLWENYHFISTFDSDTFGTHNQHKLWEVINVPFCYEDYLLVRNNNKILDSDGVSVGELITLKWNPYKQVADINFKIKEVYTKNLRTVKIIPNGR